MGCKIFSKCFILVRVSLDPVSAGCEAKRAVDEMYDVCLEGYVARHFLLLSTQHTLLQSNAPYPKVLGMQIYPDSAFSLLCLLCRLVKTFATWAVFSSFLWTFSREHCGYLYRSVKRNLAAETDVFAFITKSPLSKEIMISLLLSVLYSPVLVHAMNHFNISNKWDRSSRLTSLSSRISRSHYLIIYWNMCAEYIRAMFMSIN